MAVGALPVGNHRRKENKGEFKLQKMWEMDTQIVEGAVGPGQTEQGRCWLQSGRADQAWLNFVPHLQTGPAVFSLPVAMNSSLEDPFGWLQCPDVLIVVNNFPGLL